MTPLTSQVESPSKGTAAARNGTVELGFVPSATSTRRLRRSRCHVLLLDLHDRWKAHPMDSDAPIRIYLLRTIGDDSAVHFEGR